MKSIQRIVRNVPQHWVGDGFPVRSLFTYQEGSLVDPFLLLDYAGPYNFSPSEAKRGVGEHPHRGFETVTIVYQGEVEHGDSSGSHGTIGPGDVQWMTAASGLVHEEFHSEHFSRTGGEFEMVQLWVNLPSDKKQSSPGYQEILAASIPSVTLPEHAGYVRVIAGEFEGTVGPARTFTPINVWDIRLQGETNITLNVPDGHTAILVVQKGRVLVNDTQTLHAVELIQFDRTGSKISLSTADDAMVLLLTGEPIGEPVVGQGPFVMNTREEIQQAISDFRSGKFGRLPA